MSDGSLKSSGKWLSGRWQEHHKKEQKKCRKWPGTVFEAQLSQNVCLRASVKNVSRLLQQFAGLKAAEEPSPLGNIVWHISESDVELFKWQHILCAM